MKNAKKVLIFGMDGNLLDNYSLKSESAGIALQKNVKKFFNIDKDTNFFSEIYIDSSGLDSQKQFKIALSRIVPTSKINQKMIDSIEKDFRDLLYKKEKGIKIFPDAEDFLKKIDMNIYKTCITTSVPIDKIDKISKNTHLNKYIDIICAKGGYWSVKKITKIKGFEKGYKHYNFIMKYFGVSKKDLITYSSTIADIENAVNYKIKSIAVEHIYKKNYLKTLKPNIVASSYLDIPLPY